MFTPSSSNTETILLHFQPLPATHMKVMIDTPLCPLSKLPCPIGEASTVGGAVGIPIAWPKGFILPFMVIYIDIFIKFILLFVAEVTYWITILLMIVLYAFKASKVSNKPRDSRADRPDISKRDGSRIVAIEKSQLQVSCISMRKMSRLLPGMDPHGIVAYIPMPKAILHHGHEISLWREDIARWLYKQEIEASHVSVYMK